MMRDVECPLCHAPIGETCRSVSGRPTREHSDRAVASRDKEKRVPTQVPRHTDDELLVFARQIVTGDMLVPDGTQDWAMSLALLTPAIVDAPKEDLGCVLVPMGPHMSGYWLNGRVPAVTLQVILVHSDNVDQLQAHIDRMNAVLYPQDESVPETPT